MVRPASTDMLKLVDTYNKLKTILGTTIEPFDSVKLVEEYRRYWKPDNVRIILLAESHVFTSDQDRLIGIHSHEELPGSPSQYARFVYCLGYGENQLRVGDTSLQRAGTPQFWKILYSCNNSPDAISDFSTHLSQAPASTRIRMKIQLLIPNNRSGFFYFNFNGKMD